MKKTLVLGLDAACWEYLEPVLARGDMPMLEALRREGSWGSIESTLPAHTPTAWASIVTGKNPGKHGVFDMVGRGPHPYEFVPTSSSHRRGTPFWRRLNDHGIRVGLVNVPFTHPPDPVEGFILCGFGSPDSSDELAYPPDALGKIEAEFGEYRPSVRPEILRSADADTIYQAERGHQYQLSRIATYLANEHKVDVLVMNLMLLDHANHKMPSMALVERALADSDRDIQWVIDNFHPDNVILFSDHGSRRIKGVFVLDAWLRDRGLCIQEPRTRQERLEAINWILVQRNDSGMLGTGGARLDRASRWFGREMLGHLPEGLVQPVWNAIERDVPFAREHAKLSPALDYTQSRVYFGGTFSGLLYLNIAGREPRGVLSQEQAAQVAADLVHSLMEIRDPRRPEALLGGVHRSRDLYEGPAVRYAPDIVLDTYEASCNIATSFTRGARATRRISRYFLDDSSEFGHHSRIGMFVFSGSPFRPGDGELIPGVADLAPLVLSLYAVPIPDDYDGRLPVELMSPEFMAQYTPSFQVGDGDDIGPDSTVYSPEEADQVLEHLRALGYLD